MIRECRNCMWWEECESKARPRTGHCRAVPPGIWIIEGVMNRAWPLMEANEWCGAFRVSEAIVAGRRGNTDEAERWKHQRQPARQITDAPTTPGGRP